MYIGLDREKIGAVEMDDSHRIVEMIKNKDEKIMWCEEVARQAEKVFLDNTSYRMHGR